MWYYPNNRRTDAKMHVVIVQDVVISEKTGGDVEEDIRSVWVSVARFKKMIRDGEINNYSVLAAWALFQNGE